MSQRWAALGGCGAGCWGSVGVKIKARPLQKGERGARQQGPDGRGTFIALPSTRLQPEPPAVENRIKPKRTFVFCPATFADTSRRRLADRPSPGGKACEYLSVQSLKANDPFPENSPNVFLEEKIRSPSERLAA